MAVEPLQAPHIGQGLRVPPPEQFARREYDADEDALYLRTENDVPTISEPLDDGVWVRITADQRVVGFDIEGYRQTFLMEHPQLAATLALLAAADLDETFLIAGWLAWRAAAAAAEAVA